jgi:hypothetical protein
LEFLVSTIAEEGRLLSFIAKFESNDHGFQLLFKSLYDCDMFRYQAFIHLDSSEKACDLGSPLSLAVGSVTQLRVPDMQTPTDWARADIHAIHSERASMEEGTQEIRMAQLPFAPMLFGFPVLPASSWHFSSIICPTTYCFPATLKTASWRFLPQ